MNNDDLEVKMLEAILATDIEAAGTSFARSIRSKLAIVSMQSAAYETKIFVFVIAVSTAFSMYSSIHGNQVASIICSITSAVFAGLSIRSTMRRRQASNRHADLVRRLAAAKSVDEARTLAERLNMALVEFAQTCTWRSASSSNYAFSRVEQLSDMLEAGVIKYLERKS